MSKIEIPLLEQSSQKSLERELGILLLNRESEKISLPLASVEIEAKVISQLARVTIKQIFHNTCPENLEAVYIFPLAAGSAVSEFSLKVGERIIKGIVQERGEARQNYEAALAGGHRAALMEQERDDVFTVQVGNIPPGEDVLVEISYSESLSYYENGCNELRLPLVVSPRYIKGEELDRDPVGGGTATDTDIVPDASRITPPRLAGGSQSGPALKLKVEIMHEEKSEVSDFSCSQHATKTVLEPGKIAISPARTDEKLNRDFVLRWRCAGEKLKSSLITYSSPDGESYGLLSIVPPKNQGFSGAPRDVLFLIDRSGSMTGKKMTSAVKACSILLHTLKPADRYAVACFDDIVEWMFSTGSEQFITADNDGIEKGEKYLRKIQARGGTEMDNAIKNSLSALSGRSSAADRIPVLIVLTDGEVGDESQILQRVQKEIADARLFVVGIDTAVNAGLLKRLANLGGGTAAFVEPGVQLEEALTAISREIGVPLVTDIQAEGLDLSLDRASFSSSRIPDIFAGRPSICFFKLSGKGKGKIEVKGKLPDGSIFKEQVKAQRVEMPSIAHMWAKAHLINLEDQYRSDSLDREKLKQEMIALAVKHSLLCRFTAFVVVDESETVDNKDRSRRVIQPVEMPAEWEMTDAGFYGAVFGAPPAQSCANVQSYGSAQAPYSMEAWGAPSNTSFNGPTGAVFNAAPRKQVRQSAEDIKELIRTELQQVEKLLQEFLDEFEKAFMLVDKGGSPDAIGLESLRVKLLKALAPLNLGMKLSELQKFLRSSSVELISSLKDKTISKNELQIFWKSKQEFFMDCKNQAKSISKSEPAFWENSI